MTDWTKGAAALVFQHCGACGQVWYFARDFCPHCGARDPQTRRCEGAGRVYAITTVTRAPSPELRALAPYRIALVDFAEGFRAMIHAEDNVAIGDAVRLSFVPFGTLTVPRCARAGDAA
jgi:uncharacterized OB-fold protein